MTATFRNNAEGGTVGQTVTPYNCGAASGNAFTYALAGTDASMQFVSSPARGNVCYEFKTGATAARSRVGWRSFPSDATAIYLRLAVYIPSSMSGTALRFVELLDNAQGLVMLEVSATGKLNVRYGYGIMATTASTIKYDSWMRLELGATLDATTGQATLKVFPEADSPYPLETLVSPATFNTRPNGSGVISGNFGIVSANYSNATIYLDDFTMSTSPLSGPVNSTEALPLLYYTDAEAGTNTANVTALNSGSATNDFFDVTYIPSGGSITFTNEQTAHGSLAYKVQPVSGDGTYLAWGTLDSKSVAARCYVRFTAWPDSANEVAGFVTMQPSYLTVGRWVISQTGNLSMFDQAGVVWTSSTSIALNTWYRLELYMHTGPTSTTGTLQCAYYALDSGAAIDSFSTSAATIGTAEFSVFRFGRLNANAWTSTIYFDDVMVMQEASGFIGAYNGAPSAPTAYAGKVPFNGWGIPIGGQP